MTILSVLVQTQHITIISFQEYPNPLRNRVGPVEDGKHHLFLSLRCATHADCKWPQQSISRQASVQVGSERIKPKLSSPRLPITPSILQITFNCLNMTATSEVNDVVLRAAFLMAFFSFLRCSQSIHSYKHFSPQDVAVDNLENLTVLAIHIKN